MPTIIDVAALAGVSTATVSRVINDSGFVEPALKSKVKKAIIKLNYQPNLVARGLRSDSTSIIAVMISDIENPFYTAVCRGVQDVASEHGYAVMICNSDEDVEKESKYLGMFAGQRVAGVIISPASSWQRISAVQRFIEHNRNTAGQDNLYIIKKILFLSLLITDEVYRKMIMTLHFYTGTEDFSGVFRLKNLVWKAKELKKDEEVQAKG